MRRPKCTSIEDKVIDSRISKDGSTIHRRRECLECGHRYSTTEMLVRDGIVVIKRGEYGAALFTGDDTFAMPALPLSEVRDPTGAGDSFAGGFLGFLDGHDTHRPTNAQLRQAMVMGSAMASFNVEDFGTDRVRALGRPEIDARVAEFRALTHF